MLRIIYDGAEFFNFSRIHMPVIILIPILLTLIVLVTGIFLMGKGGKLNQKYGNKLMVARVSLQFLVIIMLAFLYFYMKK